MPVEVPPNRLEKLIAELKAKVEPHWRDPKHECSLVAHSHALQGAVVVFLYTLRSWWNAERRLRKIWHPKSLAAAIVIDA
jgi:hypothetical protein